MRQNNETIERDTPKGRSELASSRQEGNHTGSQAKPDEESQASKDDGKSSGKPGAEKEPSAVVRAVDAVLMEDSYQLSSNPLVQAIE